MKLYKLVNYKIKNNHIANNNPKKELILSLETEYKELIDDNYALLLKTLAKPIFEDDSFITQNIAVYQKKEDDILTGTTYELIKQYVDSPVLVCNLKLINFDVIAEFNYNDERVFHMPLFNDDIVTDGIYGLLKEIIGESNYSYSEDNLTTIHDEFIIEITNKWAYDLEFYNFAFLDKPMTTYSLRKLLVMLFDREFCIISEKLLTEGYLTLEFKNEAAKFKFNIEKGICKKITKF
jgi:hypothetical protein